MSLRSVEDRAALIKIEVTRGTDSIPAAANAMLLMESSIAPAADKLERKVDRPFYGGDPFVLVGKRVELNSKVDLLGAAAAGTAAPLGTIYRICGHSEVLVADTSATYAPISKNFESATIYFYDSGMWWKMLGCNGSIDIDWSIKGYAMGTLKCIGTFAVPTDGEVPSGIDWTTFQTPPAIETETWEVTMDSGAGAVAVCAQKLTLTQGADVKIIECSNNRQAFIAGRKPSGSLTVYKDATLATWNPFQIAADHTIVTLASTITKAAGLNVATTIRAQLELPKPTDIDGLRGLEIPYVAIPSGAGGDEYKHVFT
jgi:hypothetical protein